ncbi:MAG: hypothetical protein V3R57_05095 [Candidatus Bathyarchaeia archaeon]
MSHVNCPLCGRNQALSKFNPKALDDDISRSLFSRVRSRTRLRENRGNQHHDARRPSHGTGEGLMPRHHRFPFGIRLRQPQRSL